MWYTSPRGISQTMFDDGKKIVVSKLRPGQWRIHVEGMPDLFKNSYSSRGVAMLEAEIWLRFRKQETQCQPKSR